MSRPGKTGTKCRGAGRERHAGFPARLASRRRHGRGTGWSSPPRTPTRSSRCFADSSRTSTPATPSDPEQRIPPCWAEHGALVEELTTLFFGALARVRVAARLDRRCAVLAQPTRCLRSSSGCEPGSAAGSSPASHGRHRDVCRPVAQDRRPPGSCGPTSSPRSTTYDAVNADRTDVMPRSPSGLVVEFLQKEGTNK